MSIYFVSLKFHHIINIFFPPEKNILKDKWRPFNDMNVCLGRVHAASYNTNRIGGVMVRVLASSAVDRGFEPRSGHTKDYTN